MNAKEKMYEKIRIHGENLNAIFNTGLDPVTLCKRLRTIDLKAHRLCEDECNTGETHDAELCKLLTRAKKILFSNPETLANEKLYKAVFINGDPRGYTLKIKSEYVAENNVSIYRDWGGYGILAPDFTEN